MWIMILKMAAATAPYVLATVLLWKSWHKSSTHTLLHKLTIGLFYGLCSIASSHIGIDYGNMLLNARDLGPLAAGLFFDPVAGVVSGVIGGVERFIIGEYFGIGSFSRIACSVSTVLAGLLSAGLNKWVYQGNRPSYINCLFLGAEMKVFHMYVTVWLGMLDLKTGLMRCANAGHEYPALMRAGGDYALLEDPHGFVLGGFENVPMTEYEIQLTPGDRLFVYTDGIPEAMNTEGKQYGGERLTACLYQLKNGTQEQILDGMLRSIRSFAGETEQFDDITMLGITYLDSISDA